MSEADGTDAPFAKKANCEKWRKQRRFTDFNWLGVGRVQLQSAMAAEWIRIDAARNRARLAAMSGNAKLHEQATKDFMLAACYTLVLDEAGNPFFGTDDRDLILEMDSAITDPLIDACMRHCDISAIDMEAAKKN